MNKKLIVTATLSLSLLLAACTGAPQIGKPAEATPSPAAMAVVPNCTGTYKSEAYDMRPGTSKVVFDDDAVTVIECKEGGGMNFTVTTNTQKAPEAPKSSATPEAPQSTPTMAPSPTPVASPTAVASATPETMGGYPMPEFTTNFTQGEWVVSGTARLEDSPIVASWIARLKDPEPAVWKYFPNVPNPDVPDFRVRNGNEVPDGVEFGPADSPFCESGPCDFVTSGQEIRYFSGDYTVLGWTCNGDSTNGRGCMLLIVNVGQSYTWRQQYVDNGFTMHGRYFNGDDLEWGVWGVVSHGSANMLDMQTFSEPGKELNAASGSNAGDNCATNDDKVRGCKEVDVRVVVTAGDAVIAVLETTVSRSPNN